MESDGDFIAAFQLAIENRTGSNASTESILKMSHGVALILLAMFVFPHLDMRIPD